MSERTLRWWSSTLRRGTRAERGSTETALAPIEIEVPRLPSHVEHIEIAIDGVVLRVDVGADVEYVGALVRLLRGAR